jgi:hypothetical protein
MKPGPCWSRTGVAVSLPAKMALRMARASLGPALQGVAELLDAGPGFGVVPAHLELDGLRRRLDQPHARLQGVRLLLARSFSPATRAPAVAFQPSSSAWTREKFDWRPSHPSLLADLEAGGYPA